MLRTTTRALLLAALAALALAGTAQAKQIQQYFYSGESFEAGGSNPAAIAVDSPDQSVLVVGNGDKEEGLKISKFHSDGTPAPFTGLPGEPASLHTGDKIIGSAPVAIAVDESAGPSAGNFYVASSDSQSGEEGGKIYGYGRGGAPLPGFPLSLPGRPCGVAVAADGNVWIANVILGAYGEFTLTGNPTGNFLSFGARHGGCRIAIDSAGSAYLVKDKRVVKYDSGLHFLSDVGPFDLEGLFSPPDAPLGSPRIAIDRGDGTLFELFDHGASPITQADASGDPITAFGGADAAHFYTGLGDAARDLAVDPQTHDVYVLNGGGVDVFSRDASVVTVPTVTAGSFEDLTGTSTTLTATLDPAGIDTTGCHFEWGLTVAYGNIAPCSQGNVFPGGSGESTVTAAISGLTKGTVYHFRVAAKNANDALSFGRDKEFAAADPPVLGEASADHITTEAARINLAVNTEGADSTYRVEVGTDTDYGMSFPVPDARVPATIPANGIEGIRVILTLQAKTQEVHGLSPETLYHYRVIAENPAGIVEGADHTFKTFALPSTGAGACPNAQARQQTSAAGLLDCRAYELVSAPDTGGYDVRSDLSPGTTPLSTSPLAKDAALYSMQSGTIPGIAGNPTNRGADPYVATRGSNGWSTRYVGLPANNPDAAAPFASPLLAADAELHTFAFGGEDICAPCFADGSTNVPVRLPDGSLQQGVAGSDPGPAERAGEVRKPLSADGTHFIFGSKAQLESDANSNGIDLTIYERDLKTGATQVISKLPNGDTIAAGEGVAALDVSKDGSRVVIGEVISTDAEGNRYYHLYLHVGSSPNTIDLTPGAMLGVLYAGMSEDGSVVYFTTKDALTTATEQDTDTSADLYRDDIAGQNATLTRVSVGTGTGDTDACDPAANSYNPVDWNTIPGGPSDCSVVAIGGGGGVSSGDGATYFLSPEQLDGNGVAGAPNLYLANPGSSPHFVATLESSASTPLKAGSHVHQGSFGSYSNPEGVAIDNATEDVYVLDTASSFNSPGAFVQKLDSSGTPVASFGNASTIDGSGSPTGEFKEFGGFGGTPIGFPSQVAVDNAPTSPSYGDIYVPDAGHLVVDKFDSAGNYVSQIEIGGRPTGVAVNPTNGDVYVPDLFGEVHVYDATGAELTTFSTPDSFAANAAAVSSSGTVYVTSGSEITVYDSTGTFLEGPTNAFAAAISPNPAVGVAVDPTDDHVYVDQGDRVIELDSSATQVGVAIGTDVLSGSASLAVNAGQMAVSNAGAGKVSFFSPPATPPDRGYDSPLVIDSVRAPGARHGEQFQLTPSGDDAAFFTTLPLDGFNSAGKYEVYRYDEGEDTARCVSCSPTEARPLADTTLSPYGSSLTDDGRVFFTTAEPLTLRDSNEKKDAYEWEDGQQELISTGTSESDSSLLSVSSDGKDAFFFTRQKLVPEDENGSSVRLYTAREGGGYAFGPPIFECAASDECHGASTTPAAPLSAATIAGKPGQFKEEKQPQCRKGKVRRRGKCVKRHPHKRQQHNRAKSKQGGGK